MGWYFNDGKQFEYFKFGPSREDIEYMSAKYNFLNNTEVIINNNNEIEINNEDNKMKIKDILMDFSCIIPIDDYEYNIEVYLEKDNPDSYNVGVSRNEKICVSHFLNKLKVEKAMSSLNDMEKQWLEDFIKFETEGNKKYAKQI